MFVTNFTLFLYLAVSSAQRTTTDIKTAKPTTFTSPTPTSANLFLPSTKRSTGLPTIAATTSKKPVSTTQPTNNPSSIPTCSSSTAPTAVPSSTATTVPSSRSNYQQQGSGGALGRPTSSPIPPSPRPSVGIAYISPIPPQSNARRIAPTRTPSGPSRSPTVFPTNPTARPSAMPTNPTRGPTEEPTYYPTGEPTVAATKKK